VLWTPRTPKLDGVTRRCHVCFAHKATEVVRRRNMWRSAICRLMHCSRAHRRRIRVQKWATDKSRVRLCFDNPSHETIRSGVAALAEVRLREFGVPSRIANVERARA
jgi:hypothetical protein